MISKSNRLQISTLDLSIPFLVPVNFYSPSIQKVVHFLVWMLSFLVADWAWLFGDQVIWPLLRVNAEFYKSSQFSC